MTDARKELEIAEALATVQQQRLRGQSPDLLSFRERLGDSLMEFIALANADAMIDDLTDPRAFEQLPREFGSYTLQRELGQGAIGIVYEAWHKPLARKAAVKLLKPPYDREPDARERFREEAMNAARVRDDHIVEIFDVGDVNGALFYAMEVVEGRPLSALIASKALPEIPDLCRQFAGIANALEKLHRADPKPVIHRDVKPANIMVRSDGRMKLMDFGLSRVGEGSGVTQTGVAVGTPLYMPPEQILGRRNQMDGRSDVYALGATIYEAIAGEPIFEPSTFEIVSKQVVGAVPALLRTKAPECPRALETIVKNALEKRREDRYQSAAAMRDELLKVANGEDDEPKVFVTPLTRIGRWMRSPTGLAAAASALLVVGAGLWWTSRPATLEATTSPKGVEVLVAGESIGHTPLTSSIKPGSYEIRFRRDRFKDQSRLVNARPGGFVMQDITMHPLQKDDAIAQGELNEAEDVDASLHSFERNRSGADPSASLVFVVPRGNVRIEDLDSYGFEVDLRISIPDEGGVLEFRRGDERLSETPFPSSYKTGRNYAEFPKSVRDRLRVGDVVTWGLKAKRSGSASGSDRSRSTTFTVVGNEASAEFATFMARLAKRGYEAPIAGELEVRELMKLGLQSAALVRADKLADEHPDSGLLQVCALLAHAKLRIKDSARVDELNDRIDRLPKERRALLMSIDRDGAGPAEPPTRGGR